MLEELVPRLEHCSDVWVRQGVLETVHCLVESLELRIVPYIVLLVVPVLGAMSDNDSQVRSYSQRQNKCLSPITFVDFRSTLYFNLCDTHLFKTNYRLNLTIQIAIIF